MVYKSTPVALRVCRKSGAWGQAKIQHIKYLHCQYRPFSAKKRPRKMKGLWHHMTFWALEQALWHHMMLRSFMAKYLRLEIAEGFFFFTFGDACCWLPITLGPKLLHSTLLFSMNFPVDIGLHYIISFKLIHRFWFLAALQNWFMT